LELMIGLEPTTY